MRATEHAPRDRFHVLERRHGLAQIVERGSGVLVECRSERRAFRFTVSDPAATLFLGVFDEGTLEDEPIGRCAVALRALWRSRAHSSS